MKRAQINFLVMKTTVSEMKNTLDGIHSRLNIASQKLLPCPELRPPEIHMLCYLEMGPLGYNEG